MEQRIYADNRGELAAVTLEIRDTNQAAVMPRVAPMPEPETLAQAGRVYLVMKRLMDISLSLFLLSLFFVPLVVIAALIRWESQGPAIYRRRVLAWQEWREELGAEALQTFDAYKMRTMITDAEEYLKRHPHLMNAYQKDWKLQNDPRITKFGQFLRSSSIDELPQLINVLKGEMSLIGPRMITVPELERYGADAPRLLGVKPGLTGLWQVSGRQELSYEERVRLDMEYAQKRSLCLDLQILVKTVKCVLLRRGAY